jgi:hypothetical protein
MTASENKPRKQGQPIKGAQKGPAADPKADPPPKYVPTRLEAEAASHVLARRKTRQPMPLTKISDKTADKLKFGFDHDDQRIAELLLADNLGISEPAFLGGYLDGVVRVATAHNPADVASINSMMGAIYGMKPSDEAEAMLIAQMVATHDLAMTFARQATQADNIPQQESSVNGLTKLTRTYAAQMSALKDYRSKGEQRMVVQHVNVAEGGQAAIVGNVNAPTEEGGVREKNGGQPHALAYAPGVEMPRPIEKERATVPSAGGEGPANVPDARRDQPRSPDRKG